MSLTNSDAATPTVGIDLTGTDARDYAEAVVRTARDPLVSLDGDLRLIGANEAFYKTFKVSAAESEGCLIYELGNGQWNIPRLRELLEDILPRNSFFNDFEVSHDFEHIGPRSMLLNARTLQQADKKSKLILLGIQDVTEMLQFQAELRARGDELARFNRAAVDRETRMIELKKETNELRRRLGEEARYPLGGESQESEQHGELALARQALHESESHSNEELARRVTDLEAANAESENARRAALNLMEDAVQSRQHLEAANAALRDSEQRLQEELAATQQLQSASALLIEGGDTVRLYQKMVDAAAAIMRSDYASMQMYYPQRGRGGELLLLAFRGFNPQAVKFWEWVRADSQSACGAALRTGKRVIVSDVEKCEWMAGTDDLETSLRTGIRAVQTTPLVSRSGGLLGMISTHWRIPHTPMEGDLGRLDILARQAADLIERKQAEDRQHVLTNELAHRSKNLLAVVQTIVTRSLSGMALLDEARDTLTQRIQALSRSQSVLLKGGFEGAHLSEIIRLEFEAFSERVEPSGPDLILNPRATQAMALLVHELATNATKHGALSRPQGRVAIDWSIEGAGNEAIFSFQWQERDGPPVAPPTRNGFGRVLIEKAVAQDLSAQPRIEFAPEGLRYRIDAPLSVIAGGAVLPETQRMARAD